MNQKNCCKHAVEQGLGDQSTQGRLSDDFYVKSCFLGSPAEPILDPKPKKRVPEIYQNVSVFMYRG